MQQYSSLRPSHASSPCGADGRHIDTESFEVLQTVNFNILCWADFGAANTAGELAHEATRHDCEGLQRS